MFIISRLGHANGHAVLHAPETPSRIGCLLRVESDVFYNLKTWVQARQGLLSGWPTPTYCDVTGACETHTSYDLNGPPRAVH